MTKALTLNVRVGGALGAFVAENVGDGGLYENVSEYVRDLIRRDKARADEERFERLKAELSHAFVAPDSVYETLDVEQVLARNGSRERE
jgi:putative addiction module CopG family antidote